MAHLPSVAVLAQRCRASCSALVGRPRERRGGGGSAGRVDSIHSRTSRSYQHRRRLCGSLNGRGIRWAYLALVAHVLIVVAVLPMSGASCSMKRIRGRSAGAATGGRAGATPAGVNPSAIDCATGFGVLFERAGRGESPVRATGDDLGIGVSQANALARADAVGCGVPSYWSLKLVRWSPHLTVPCSLGLDGRCRLRLRTCIYTPAGTRRALSCSLDQVISQLA